MTRGKSSADMSGRCRGVHQSRLAGNELKSGTESRRAKHGLLREENTERKGGKGVGEKENPV